MSCGGTISTMAASLKNNARSRRKDYYKKFDEDAKFIPKKSSVKTKEESKKKLAKIRKRLVNEDNIAKKWQIITISVFLIFTIYLLFYFEDLFM